MTSIDKIHAFYQAQNHLSQKDKPELKKLFGISKEDEIRIGGLQKENEFRLIIHLLGFTKSIVGIDESTSALSDVKSTDFLVTIFDCNNEKGRKLAIEVKSTQKDAFKITNKTIDDKEKFADDMGAELYFAINMSGHWMLFDSDYVKQRSKITIQDDYKNSQFEKLLGERLFLFVPGLELISIYSKRKKGLGIKHDDYGELIRYEIKFKNKRLFNLTLASDEYLAVSYALEHLQDVMSNQYQEIIKLDDDRTLIKEKLTENVFIKLSSFMLAPIKHMVKDVVNEPHTLESFTELLKTDKNYLSRKHILSVLSFLDEKGYPVVMFLGEDGYRINDLRI